MPSVVGALPKTTLSEPVVDGVVSVCAGRSAEIVPGDSTIIVGPGAVAPAVDAAPAGGPVGVVTGLS